MIALYLAVNRRHPEQTEGLTICLFKDGVASRTAVTPRGEIAENVRSEVKEQGGKGGGLKWKGRGSCETMRTETQATS